MQRIFKRKALVRKMLAAETLGSVTIVLSDKTGTLTKGVMSVSKTEFTDKKQAVRAAYFANAQEDPLEIALIEWLSSSLVNNKRTTGDENFLESNSSPAPISKKIGAGRPAGSRYMNDFPKNKPFSDVRLSRSGLTQTSDSSKILSRGSSSGAPVSGFLDLNLQEDWKKVWEQPFSSEKKYQAAEVEDGNGKRAVYVSGAPEVVLNMCKLSGKERKEWEKKIDKWADKGLRIIGLAHTVVMPFMASRKKKPIYDAMNRITTRNLMWLGLVGIEDPVREEVVETLEKMHAAGIKLKIVTGDYLGTAVAVWGKIKAKSKILTQAYKNEKFVVGADLGDVENTTIFARVNPHEKHLIVTQLQEAGEVVAIFGDGVNDVLALKRADIGVVVNEAADTAKETADIVLLDSNFKTVIAAIEEGRGIYENIKKVMLYLLSDSFSEIILILLALIFQVPLPLTAAQILWINLLTDGFPNLALTVEPKEKGLLRRKPIDSKAGLLTGEIKILIATISAVTGVVSFVVFWLFLKSTGNIVLARTVVFTALGIDSLIYVFSVRSLTKPFFKIPVMSNPFLLVAVGFGIILQLVALYLPFFNKFLATVPLGIGEWGVVLGASIFVIALIEIIKYSCNKAL
jgi:Ca2+-transporting ATPase